MKYLLTFLLLTGCATNQLTDYEQGCYDSLDGQFRYAPETDKLKVTICKELARRKLYREWK